jgi:integrase
MGQEITTLIDGCRRYLRKNSYSNDRIQTYESLWRNGIIPFMNEKGLTNYSLEVSQQFMDSIAQRGFINAHQRDRIRSVQVLDDFLDLGYVRKRRTIPVEHPLLGEIGMQMQKHIENLQSLRFSKITVNRNRVYLHRFLTHLGRCGVENVNEIQDQHVFGFLSSPETNNRHVISTLRVMFRFWHNQKITEKDLTGSLTFFKTRRREKIPSYYNKDEISRFEVTIDRTSGLGKRNYAILLLASRLGLRASDIVELKFSNIDWKNNEIRLCQYKTGIPIYLPLLSEVGNAIIDYLKYGRHNSDLQNIFLSQRPPYLAITATTIGAMVSRIIAKSGIEVAGRHHGSHSLRHSLASRLLEQEVTMPVISEILGHSTSQTTMAYLRIDMTSLMKCALPVSISSDDFYTQKGGLFYE